MTYCPPPPRRSWRDALILAVGLAGLALEHVAAFACVLLIALAVLLAAIGAGIA